jgi:hypothetical protein
LYLRRDVRVKVRLFDDFLMNLMYWAGQALVAAWETGEEMPFIFDTVMCKLEEPALLTLLFI